RAAHVAEPSVHVLEQRRARDRLAARVRVDDEEVLPAVAVVVEPAEAAAHHRLGLRRDAVAEGSLAEVEAERGRDVAKADAGERVARRAAGRLQRRSAGGDRPAAAGALA